MLQDGNATAVCEPLPCLPGRLFFPGGKGCHRVGTPGPCPPGQVVLFQDSVKTSVEGISYQGMCGCATQSHDGRSVLCSTQRLSAFIHLNLCYFYQCISDQQHSDVKVASLILFTLPSSWA